MTRNEKTIPLEECKGRHVYRVESRSLGLNRDTQETSYAVFDRPTNSFIGLRDKGEVILWNEHHWDIGPPHGTCCPVEDVGTLPNGLFCAVCNCPELWQLKDHLMPYENNPELPYDNHE